MSCLCENIECLRAGFNPCSAGAQIPIVATETGNWNAEIEFNGSWSAFEFGVIDGEKIIIPTSYLNGNYIQTLKLYGVAGELVNDTCYQLDAYTLSVGGDFTPIIPSQMETYVQMVVMGAPDDTLNNVFGTPVSVPDGNTIQLDDLKGASLFSVENATSELLPITGVGINSFNATTGTITLSSAYEASIFKVIYKK